MRAFQWLFAVTLASPEAMVEQLRQKGATAIEVYRVQLDLDGPLEAVVEYVIPEKGVHAMVLDSEGVRWREAGGFNSWWNYAKADRERFLEFRETVDNGVKDLLVRTRSGGTEESKTTLDIYRLRNGVMVNVLSIVEVLSAMEHPSGDVFTTTAAAELTPGRVTVRAVKVPGNQKSCRVYEWDSLRYRFEETGNCLSEPAGR